MEEGALRSSVSGRRMDQFVLGCDVGGSTTRVGLVDRDQKLRHLLSAPTPASADELVVLVGSMGTAAAKHCNLDMRSLLAVGIAVPAPVVPNDGIIGSCENLPDYTGFPLGAHLVASLEVPVTIENDANAAAFGEMTRGAARGVQDFVLMVVGTGVGLGIVADGRVVRGSGGAAGEIGFLPLPGVISPSSRRHLLHQYVSGRHLPAYASDLGERLPKSSRRDGADASTILAEAATGDPLARAVLANVANYLSTVIRLVVTLLDPALVLMAGGVGANALVVRAVSEAVVASAATSPAIRVGQLADRAGVVGMAGYALDLAENPSR